MKIIQLVLINLLIFATANAQNVILQEPMNERSFKRYYDRIQKIDDEDKRVIRGIELLKDDFITANQLFLAVALFEDDNNKLHFAELASEKVSDRINILVVCDAFGKISYALKFYDFIRENRAIENQSVPAVVPFELFMEEPPKDKLTKEEINKKEHEIQIKEPELPDMLGPIENRYSFPEHSFYTGIKKCNNPLTDNVFEKFYTSVSGLGTEREKTEIILEYAEKYCFSTAQIMRLALLITNENIRYVMLITLFNNVFDPGNYLFVKQLLGSNELVAGIDNLFSEPATLISAEQKKCIVSNDDMNKIIASIRKESLSTTRFEMAQKIIPEYKCFLTEQIIEIIKLFSFETDKLSFAKFAYEFTSDKNNYNRIQSLFIYQSSKDDLMNYIKEF